MVSSAARPLQDQKTLVTGGSSGIGAATARAFARAGAAVGVNYRSKASAAEELVREIRDQGGEAIALKADVSRDDEVRAMFDWLVEAFGHIDILVANAGIQKDAAITNMSLEDWRAVLDINLTGQFLCVREAIRANNALCPRLELTRNVGYHRSGSWIRHCTAERRPHQPSPRAPRVKPQGGRKPRALRGAACRDDADRWAGIGALRFPGDLVLAGCLDRRLTSSSRRLMLQPTWETSVNHCDRYSWPCASPSQPPF
jgi:hypothetical protein